MAIPSKITNFKKEKEKKEKEDEELNDSSSNSVYDKESPELPYNSSYSLTPSSIPKKNCYLKRLKNIREANIEEVLKEIDFDDSSSRHNNTNILFKDIQWTPQDSRRDSENIRVGRKNTPTIHPKGSLYQVRNTTRRDWTIRKRLKPNYLIIFPDDKFKSIWDIMILLMLAYTTLVTPFRISFVESDDSILWICMDSIVDGFFGVDIFINCISAYYDEDDELITDKKSILRKYLKGWFLIDFFSILPISYIMQSQKDYTSLARLARLPRLYRLIKIAKYLIERIISLLQD